MDSLFNNIKTYSDFDDESDCQKIGIFVVKNQTYQPPTYIRLLSIFNNINSKFNACLINVNNQNEIDSIKSDLLNDDFLLDIIIISREAFHSNEFLDLLLKKCKLLGIKIIYELDDDLIDIDKSHRDYEYYAKKREGIYKIAKNSSRITVSTNALKNKLLEYNNNITVIPNVITHYWECDVEKRVKDENIIKIGYMGTPTHKDDIKVLEETMQIVKDYFKNKNKKIIFEMIGGTAEKLEWANQIEITLENKFFPNFVKFFKENVNWDVAVAPLEDNHINASKSELKYLEYSYMGIPGVYSAIGPYEQKINHGDNGLLVYNNSPQEWAKNIINLIENEKLRNKIVSNSINDVETNHNLNLAIDMWTDVLEENCRNKENLLYQLFKSYTESNLQISFSEFINKNCHKIINDSGLFDEEFYFSMYPDVKLCGCNPIEHYLSLGVEENCNPNNYFDTESYLINYPDVKKLGLNPLVHSILYETKPCGVSNIILQSLENEYKFSIIMPTFNRRNIISRSINSVLKQTFKNFELIIIDDGSSDNTEDFIKTRYSTQIKLNKIKYFKLNHEGVCRARNFGLNMAEGNIIAYLDSDNEWNHKFLEEMINELHKNKGYNCAYCAVKVNHLNNQTYVLGTEFNRKNLLKQNFIDINSFIHKKELLEQKGCFDENLTRLVDWDLIIRFTEKNNPLFINKVLVNYFIDEDLDNITLVEPLGNNMEYIHSKYWAELYEKEYNIIKDYFDYDYYLNEYRDVLRSNMNPIYHFLSRGYREKRNPNSHFNTSIYLESHPNLIKEDFNPFVHFIKSGMVSPDITLNKKREKIINTNLIYLSNYSFDKVQPMVSIIILNRNGFDHLKVLFKDFALKANYSNFEIIVVDNNSSDRSVEYLKTLDDLPITILENKENVSFSKGNNDAIDIAKGDYILLLNNDIEPTYGWLNEMMGTILFNENIGAVGAKLLYPHIFDKNKQKFSFTIQHAGDIFIEKIKPDCQYGALNRNKFSQNIFDKHLIGNKKCLLVTGAVLLIKKDIYLELGGLDEQFWYGYEDIDFNLRLYQKGYDVILCNNALLFHHESATPRESSVLPYNAQLLCKKWGAYLFKQLLRDKIEKNHFFTDKQLNIMIVANHDFHEDKKLKSNIRGILDYFNKNEYNTNFISDLTDFEIGGDVDILISFTKDYDIKKIHARTNIIKILIINEYSSNYDYDSWDIGFINDLEWDGKINSSNGIHLHFVNDFSELGKNIIFSLYETYLKD